MYPAVLSGLGVWGNYIILGGKIADLSKALKEHFRLVQDDLKEIKCAIRYLNVEQLDLEHNHVSIAEEILRFCKNNK